MHLNSFDLSCIYVYIYFYIYICMYICIFCSFLIHPFEFYLFIHFVYHTSKGKILFFCFCFEFSFKFTLFTFAIEVLHLTDFFPFFFSISSMKMHSIMTDVITFFFLCFLQKSRKAYIFGMYLHCCET